MAAPEANTEKNVPLLAAVFSLSGAAGLIYETAWTRYLSLFVGHSAYAQVLVLVIFLGGMAVGAMLVGARSHQLRAPLIVYAIVELIVGLLGACFHSAFTTVSHLAYTDWFPSLGPGPLMVATKWAIAGALIFPQSVLLGATFPLMTAGALRMRALGAGHTLGLLYFANSIGASCGVLLEGFVLIGAVGLNGTLLVAAGLNLLVAGIVLVARRGFREPANGVAERAIAHESRTQSHAGAPRLLWPAILAVSFGTALSSFFYEIGWIRMLSLVEGSATHSFELMLSAFILGLALGAFWIRRRMIDSAHPLRVLGVVQWTMGVLAIATLPVYLLTFHAMAWIMDKAPQTDRGYVMFTVARYALSLAVMLPATFCAGMTLPLATRTLLGAGFGERAVGMVYGFNTLGSIIGVAVAALVLMPVIGLKGILMSGALLDIAIGVALVAWDQRQTPPARLTSAFRHVRLDGSVTAAAAATLACVLGVVYLTPFDRSVLSSAVYRHGRLLASGSTEFLYYRDGRTATVSLRRWAGDTSGTLTLATNGKPDASVTATWRTPVDPTAPPIPLNEDMGTQILLPLIALAHQPHARRAAVIGEGSGMTSHVLLGSPELESLETIEIEPEMVHASHGFYPANRRVFDDPRSHFVLEDARSFLAASGRSYDLIVSEPSNPWVSGVSGLFTIEFYQRMRAQLAPTGVLGQWLHLYEINDDLVESVLAAIDRVFPAYDVYLTSNADILIVAGNGEVLPSPDWSVAAYPALRSDLARVTPLLPENLAAMRIAGRSILHPLLEHVVPNSDFNSLLDLGTERTRFQHHFAKGLLSMGESRFDVAAMVDHRVRAFGAATVSPATEIKRVNGLAWGAALREALHTSPAAHGVVFGRATRDTLQRYRVFMEFLRGTRAPTSWHDWTTDFLAMEGVLHRGTAGVVDTAFYAGVDDFLSRVRPPKPVLATVAFAHGLASWDFDEVNRASGTLVMDCVAGDNWLPIDVLRDGAVIGRLMKGDTTEARRLNDQLTPHLPQPPTMRDAMIAALVGDRPPR